jgi:predicted RNA-binding Zn-ribbon protein involved in translation (DUF1610 family)
LNLSASPRLVNWIIYALLQFAVPAIPIGVGMLLQSVDQSNIGMPVGAFGIVWAAVMYFFARPIAACLTPFFISEFQCPGCGERQSAIGRFQCCGFVDHRETHALRFRCPMCGSQFGHTSCPQCEATIFIR